jgi:hypothetical protein
LLAPRWSSPASHFPLVAIIGVGLGTVEFERGTGRATTIILEDLGL